MLVIYSICTVLSGIPMAMIAPFYPPLAYSKGVDPIFIGLVLAMHPFGQLTTTLFLGKYMSKVSKSLKEIFFQ